MDANRQALDSLMDHPQWPVVIALLRERRETWIDDTKDSRVYGDHAELVHVNARVAEIDHWLKEFSRAE